MGCCGHNFPSAKSVKRAIKLNSSEFEKMAPKSREEFLGFRNRRFANDLRGGVCRNLIEGELSLENSGGAKKKCIHCPLHPSLHKGDDLRIGHCDVDYLCKTAQVFAAWDKGLQKEFIDFVTSQGLDNISYSLAMDAGSLLHRFLEKKSL